jgi:hypothetical protein
MRSGKMLKLAHTPSIRLIQLERRDCVPSLQAKVLRYWAPGDRLLRVRRARQQCRQLEDTGVVISRASCHVKALANQESTILQAPPTTWLRWRIDEI